jgi:hypothetical protein
MSVDRICKNMNKVASAATEEWEQLTEEDPGAPVRLYYKEPKAKERVGRLKVARRDPKRGWKLVVNMVMSARWTRDETLYFIKTRMLQLPIIRGPFKV